MKNVKQYYKELGKVLYVIAKADGIVQQEEIGELHRFVASELALHEHTYDSSGMNKAFYVDFEFDGLVEEDISLHNAVTNFVNFVLENREQGDGALLDRSVRLMESVVNSYNKEKEKYIINEIKQITMLPPNEA